MGYHADPAGFVQPRKAPGGRDLPVADWTWVARRLPGRTGLGGHHRLARPNGVFGYCLGCQMYVLIRRSSPARGVSA
jgi:hypothetical protein